MLPLKVPPRRAFKDAELSLNECIENDGNHVKSLFRRGQVRVDLRKWELARDDFRRATDLGGAAVEADVAKELARLKRMERAQDVNGPSPQLDPRSTRRRISVPREARAVRAFSTIFASLWDDPRFPLDNLRLLPGVSALSFGTIRASLL